MADKIIQVVSVLFLCIIGVTRLRYFLYSKSKKSQDDSANSFVCFPAYAISDLWILYMLIMVFKPSWAFFGKIYLPLSFMFQVFGIVLILLGALLFIYSHRVIGKFWNISIDIKDKHKLITIGPYKHIRHPLYTAFFICFIGTLFVIQTIILLFLFIPFVLAYYLMAKREEKVLMENFGDRYIKYSEDTGMFFKLKFKMINIKI